MNVVDCCVNFLFNKIIKVNEIEILKNKDENSPLSHIPIIERRKKEKEQKAESMRNVDSNHNAIKNSIGNRRKDKYLDNKENKSQLETIGNLINDEDDFNEIKSVNGLNINKKNVKSNFYINFLFFLDTLITGPPKKITEDKIIDKASQRFSVHRIPDKTASTKQLRLEELNLDGPDEQESIFNKTRSPSPSFYEEESKSIKNSILNNESNKIDNEIKSIIKEKNESSIHIKNENNTSIVKPKMSSFSKLFLDNGLSNPLHKKTAAKKLNMKNKSSNL